LDPAGFNIMASGAKLRLIMSKGRDKKSQINPQVIVKVMYYFNGMILVSLPGFSLHFVVIKDLSNGLFRGEGVPASLTILRSNRNKQVAERIEDKHLYLIVFS
jgi:hypothetical protein